MEPALRVLSTAIGEVGSIGLACLMALHVANRNVPEHELMATVHVESIATLRRHLNFCSAHEYASMVKPSRAAAALWHITDIGRSIIIRVISLLGLPGASTGTAATTAEPRMLITATDMPAVEEKNFFSTPSSSSSDPIDQSGSDSDQIEEEEEGREFKKFLCAEYGLTGDRAQRLIDDPRIWSDDLVAWMCQVHEMKRCGFRFRKSPEAYALACVLKDGGPERPSNDMLDNARPVIDAYWQRYQQRKKWSQTGGNDA